MNNNNYNVYTGNQNFNYDQYNPESNNSATTENYDLIDLSSQSSNQCAFVTTEENVQNESRQNRVIRTKGARKIVIDQTGESYQSAAYEIPEQDGINTPQVRNNQAVPINDLASLDVIRDTVSDRVETLDLVPFDLQTVDDNSSGGEENNEIDSAANNLTMAKLEQHSDLYKLVLMCMSKNLPTVKFSPEQSSTDICVFTKGVLNAKALEYLAKVVMDVLKNGSIYLGNKSQTAKTYIPMEDSPVPNNNCTQATAKSVPRIKINTRSNKKHQNNDLNNEHNRRHFHKLQASNQESSVCNNQQEQFYANQNAFSQPQAGMSYPGQNNMQSRNNAQAPMMHYEMPHTANAMYNSSIQRAEPGNNGGQMVMQYGMPNADNTVMQNAERGYTGTQQVAQYGIPQNQHSVIQRTDVSRRRMPTMVCPRTCSHANATATATVPPTYYNRRAYNVQRQEMPSVTQPMVMQTGPHATQASTMRGRVSRSHSYYANSANPPYPTGAHRLMPGYQDQYRNN